MRAIFAALVGLATGVLVARAPVANGAVLLLGVLIGTVLTLAFVWNETDAREEVGADVR